jgi:hypothetical protein
MNVFLGWLGLVILLLLLGPILTIWSLNTLFPVLNIPYTMETWLAVVFLGGGAGILKFSKSNS